MKHLYLFIIAALMLQCNSYKKAEKNLLQGNFDYAFEQMLEKNIKGVKEKDYSQWVKLLQTAYTKANQENTTLISRATQSPNSAQKYKDLYYTYLQLQERQDKIETLLPIIHNNKEVHFATQNYTTQINNNKQLYADFLYAEAQSLLAVNDKYEARNAYNKLVTVENLFSNYPNIYNAKQNAYDKGISNVLVEINNHSSTILPRMLENELQDFSYLTKNNFWYRFHLNEDKKVTYDNVVALNFRNIQVSPDQVTRDRFVKEKDVKDGWEYLRNENGGFVIDSSGHKIKVDKYITVSAEVNELRQFKESFITADVIVYDTQKMLEKFPIESHFVFEDYSARIKGDNRALEDIYIQRAKNRPLPMPSSEQMVYDCGQDLKQKLQRFIEDYY